MRVARRPERCELIDAMRCELRVLQTSDAKRACKTPEHTSSARMIATRLAILSLIPFSPRFFVVHPTFWVKMVFWTLSPIVSDKFWSKLKYINELSELEKFLEIEKLGLTDEIINHDRTRSGSSGVGRGGSGGAGAEEAPVHVPTRISEARKLL